MRKKLSSMHMVSVNSTLLKPTSETLITIIGSANRSFYLLKRIKGAHKNGKQPYGYTSDSYTKYY